jgi:hypothetical protein
MRSHANKPLFVRSENRPKDPVVLDLATEILEAVELATGASLSRSQQTRALAAILKVLKREAVVKQEAT